LAIPFKNPALQKKLRAVLVLASTQLMGEIEGVLGDKLCIVCGAGTWAYNKVFAY
jgi:hypothetical protein